MNNEEVLEMTSSGGNISTWVEKPKIKNLTAAACSGLMPPDKFSVHMVFALQDEKIAHCTERSKLVAFLECAALCILPSVEQCYLVPYKNKKGQYEVKVTPSWRGFKDVMERHPLILELCPELVHKGDHFSVDNGYFIHTYNPFDPNRNIDGPEDIVGGYVKIVYADGRPPKYHTMPVKDISKNQKCAKTQDTWRKWYKQMATKTLLRDCHSRKAVPIDPLVAHGVETLIRNDDVILGNDPARVEAPRAKLEQTMFAAPTDPPEQPAPPTPTSTGTPEPQEVPEPAETPDDPGEVADAVIINEWLPSIANCVDVGQCNNCKKYADELQMDQATKTEITRLIDARAEDIRSTRGAGSNASG